ncbi:hypothetical protein ACWD4J_30480 [Streptomyces sp. NPDC002577]
MAERMYAFQASEPDSRPPPTPWTSATPGSGPTPRTFEAISQRLRANAVTVLEEAERRDTTPHAAARSLAEERVRTAMRSKGRLPG